jgi:P4 family phage/plasmid primase-like protien
MSGALDRPIHITTFPDLGATERHSEFMSLRAFADQLRDTRAPTKRELRLFSLCSFGDKRTAKRSLRHDRNVRECFALVGDYDGEAVTPAAAAAALTAAGIAALVVTTPSHTPDKPRWRVIVPLTDPLCQGRTNAQGLTLDDYPKLISRLAGVLPANLAPESWTLSQSWYLGTVTAAADHGLLATDGAGMGDRPELDADARPKPPPAPKARPPGKRRTRRAGNGADAGGADLFDTAIQDAEAAPAPLSVADALFALGDDGPGIHDALVSVAGKFAAEGMSKATAEAIILQAFDRRPEDQRDQRWHDRRAETGRTLDWAYGREAEQQTHLTAIMASAQADAGGNGNTPPPPPDATTGWVPGGPEPEPPPIAVTTATPPPLDLDAAQPRPYTHDAMALVFALSHTNRLRFVQFWGKWFVWDGRVWQQDDTLRSFSLTRLLLRQAAAGTTKNSIARALGDASTVAAVERLARSDRRLAATTTRWDAGAHLLNTPAGVIDLRSGAVLAHDPGRYMTKITAVAPGGSCPRWLAFLDRITGGDRALQAYLQRMVGYCLTGSTREHVLLFGYGTGANGKGVFVNTLHGILGDYAAVASMETFTETRNEQHSCNLAMLRGARLVVASETEDGKRWAESRIKLLSGGDAVTARFMRQDFFTYVPTFKLLITGNHRPALRNVDEAVRRRLHLIPFAVTIPETERDHRLTERLRHEWPGILAWALQGCLMWQRDGLAPPDAVLGATADYLADEDVVQRWSDEHCIIAKGQASYGSALYSSFKAWCELEGERVHSHRWFTQALLNHGYRSGRDQRGGGDQRTIEGLILKHGTGVVPP